MMDDPPVWQSKVPPDEMFLFDMIALYFRRNRLALEAAGTPDEERLARLAHWSWLALCRLSARRYPAAHGDVDSLTAEPSAEETEE